MFKNIFRKKTNSTTLRKQDPFTAIQDSTLDILTKPVSEKLGKFSQLSEQTKNFQEVTKILANDESSTLTDISDVLYDTEIELNLSSTIRTSYHLLDATEKIVLLQAIKSIVKFAEDLCRVSKLGIDTFSADFDKRSSSVNKHRIELLIKKLSDMQQGAYLNEVLGGLIFLCQTLPSKIESARNWSIVSGGASAVFLVALLAGVAITVAGGMTTLPVGIAVGSVLVVSGAILCPVFAGTSLNLVNEFKDLSSLTIAVEEWKNELSSMVIMENNHMLNLVDSVVPVTGPIFTMETREKFESCFKRIGIIGKRLEQMLSSPPRNH